MVQCKPVQGTPQGRVIQSAERVWESLVGWQHCRHGPGSPGSCQNWDDSAEQRTSQKGECSFRCLSWRRPAPVPQPVRHISNMLPQRTAAPGAQSMCLDQGMPPHLNCFSQCQNFKDGKTKVLDTLSKWVTSLSIDFTAPRQLPAKEPHYAQTHSGGTW